MVTTRGNSSFADLQRSKSAEWFENYGRNDITYISKTVTTNASGRTSSVTTSTTTITGDLQFDFKLISEYIRLGQAQKGDGIFYTSYSNTINEQDEIEVDGIRWRLYSQVEGEQTKGETIYQGWLCRRI